MELKVICIDDKHRPENIPVNKWIREGEIYTIIKVQRMVFQNMIQGVKIAEINIDDCFPYNCFALSRFRPLTFGEDLADQLEKECTIADVEYLEPILINSK